MHNQDISRSSVEPPADPGDASASDADIQERCESMVSELGNFPDVQVLVLRGWVRLTGTVPNAPDRWRVEQAIASVAGVLGINGQLSVDAAEADDPDQI